MFGVLVSSLTKLVEAHDWNLDDATCLRNKGMAGAILGYGVSLCKASGMTRHRVIEVINEKWSGMQGGG